MSDTDVCQIVSQSLPTGPQVSIQRLAYSVPEGSTVRVCAIVVRTSVSCQINFPFSIKIYTEDGTAGII